MASKTRSAVVAASLLLVGALLTPAVVLAQRSNGGGGNGGAMGRGTGGGRPAVGQQSFGNQWSPNHHHGFVGRPFFRPFVRPFFPFAVAPAVVYAAPYYYPPPTYYDPPPTYYTPPTATYYSPPPATYYSPAPPSGTLSIAPAPPDNVIQYSHGRYELRGDGVSTPYRWVWIPNPTAASGRAPTAAGSAAVLRAAGRLIVGRPGRATPEPALSLDRHGGRRALDGSDRRGSREVPRGREAIPALLR